MTKAERIAQIVLKINEARIVAETDYANNKEKLAETDAAYRELLVKGKAAEILSFKSIKNSGEYEKLIKAANDAIFEKIHAYELQCGINLVYSCTRCKDTGYVNEKLCECVIKKLNSVQKQADFGDLPQYNLNDTETTNKLFKGTLQENEMLNIYDNFAKYARLFPNLKYKNILLIGGSGCGKSGAVIALYNEILALGHTALYLNSFSMHNAFLHYHTAKMEDKAQYLDKLLDVDFLAIDDLGTEPIFKNVTLEYLYLLLETRISTGKATAITTNLTPDALINRYGERLVSRMTSKAYTLVRFIPLCTDLRTRK